MAAACAARKVDLFDRQPHGLSFLSMLWKPFEVAFHTAAAAWPHQRNSQAMSLLPAVLVERRA